MIKFFWGILIVKAYILVCPLGIFALNEKGRIIVKKLFGLSIEEALKGVGSFIPGRVPEIDQIIEDLKNKKYESLISDDENLTKYVKKSFKIKTYFKKPCKQIDDFKDKMPFHAVKLKVTKTESEFNKFMHELSVQIARKAVTEAITKRDLYAVQAVRTVDDLDKTINLFAGRIREWYGLHFPELDRAIDNHDTYARLIQNLGNKDNFTKKDLEKAGLPKDKAKKIAEIAQISMGANIEEEDLKWIKSFAEEILNLYKLRESIEEYIDKVMKEIAPNMSSIVGSVISARLISIAGGLENLAKMPASTLQVLGAEKALFRALKTGSRPPKHGIIFQYALIHQAPKWLRGKIARVLSGRLSIASRLDAFEGEFAGERLKKDVIEKVNEIKEKYKSPPPMAPKVRRRHARRKG
jgi:nucleolar protein 56